ncbi:MAG: TIGR00304 family protein [Candidatus Aramenus sp.]|jgi:uncharacterized protein (TIGR00304 family)|nr:TIGR00304 family protein [Candidatus Aramenus sp.]
MEGLIELGILLIFLGFLIVFLSVIYEALKNSEGNEEKRETKAGGIILIGPIPIVFGSNKEIAKWMIVVALIITAILVALYVLAYL